MGEPEGRDVTAPYVRRTPRWFQTMGRPRPAASYDIQSRLRDRPQSCRRGTALIFQSKAAELSSTAVRIVADSAADFTMRSRSMALATGRNDRPGFPVSTDRTFRTKLSCAECRAAHLQPLSASSALRAVAGLPTLHHIGLKRRLCFDRRSRSVNNSSSWGVS